MDTARGKVETQHLLGFKTNISVATHIASDKQKKEDIMKIENRLLTRGN